MPENPQQVHRNPFHGRIESIKSACKRSWKVTLKTYSLMMVCSWQFFLVEFRFLHSTLIDRKIHWDLHWHGSHFVLDHILSMNLKDYFVTVWWHVTVTGWIEGTGTQPDYLFESADKKNGGSKTLERKDSRGLWEIVKLREVGVWARRVWWQKANRPGPNTKRS